ncbi:MAG: site-specific DNA-methyltransferase, partial [Hellea sp.]|nr:site-specific DNA-methyltransferase [Hellea sp.]
YQTMKQGDWHEGDIIKKDGKQMRSVWSIPLTKKSEKRHGKHPTQKPEALLERIILAASNPGDTVLDPFCGSGTTGVAALRHGRNFIGIDMDRDFLEGIAWPRLEDELRTDKPESGDKSSQNAADKLIEALRLEVEAAKSANS